MNYENFVYDLIQLLVSWGMWKDSIKILYGEKCYCPCRMIKSTSDKLWDYEDYCRRYEIYQADIERSVYRDLKNVVVSEMTDEEKTFQGRWDAECEMYVELNGPLNNLFEYGILVADLADLPLSRKQEMYSEREELQEQFREEYDVEEIRIDPEEYGIPSELEFDSADEYDAFFENELQRLESEFVANLTGKIEFNNELEAEICDLCINHGLSYSFTGDSLIIGHGYF